MQGTQKQKPQNKKKWYSLFGIAVGVINAFLGAGGGMLVVPILRKQGLDQTRAHATSISVILPLTICSAVMYLKSGYVTISDAVPYLIPGAIGAVAGAILLPKIPKKWLKRIFVVFILWAAVRMFIA